MNNFNFYINVDQCLSMSKYEMFFYKLEYERKFHLSNVTMCDQDGMVSMEVSEKSLDKTFQEIRSHIDKSPFLITKYRMVFGIRQKRQCLDCYDERALGEIHKDVTKAKEILWKQSVLYKLLCIYYGLRKNKLFIKSRESADKNVSVIVLYDTDLRLDMPDLPSVYDVSEDIILLAHALGIVERDGNNLQTIDHKEIFTRFLNLVKSSDEIIDGVTDRFVRSYVKSQENIFQFNEKNDLEDYTLSYRTEFKPKYEVKQEITRKMQLHNALVSLIQFTSDTIGHYCVFQKEMDQNGLSDRLLSFLSIVDYITSDLKPYTGENRNAIETLREQSKRTWEESMNDTEIQRRYGTMIDQYQKTLQNKLEKMGSSVSELDKAEFIYEYEEPAEIVPMANNPMENESSYTKTFSDLLKRFERVSLNRKKGLAAWCSTYKQMKENLNAIEQNLADFASDLTSQYKKQLSDRIQEKKALRIPEKVYFDQEMIDENQENFTRQRANILDALKEEKMNPSLKLADQLNLDNALEACNGEITFYLKCQSMIHTLNFLLAILICGGGVLFHHILMQTYIFSDEKMFLALLGYVGITLVFFLLCYNAPAAYFRRRIRSCLHTLKDNIDCYIKGYFDKAKDFQTYINLINELDAVNGHLELMDTLAKMNDISSRKYLWHKARIMDHLKKIEPFKNLVYSLGFEDRVESELCACEIDYNSDVIHNMIYWPQRNIKEDIND